MSLFFKNVNRQYQGHYDCLLKKPQEIGTLINSLLELGISGKTSSYHLKVEAMIQIMSAQVYLDDKFRDLYVWKGYHPACLTNIYVQTRLYVTIPMQMFSWLIAIFSIFSPEALCRTVI
jgi:hypothetical protein